MKLVAVYGSLKRGFFNHSLLGDAKFIGEFKTKPEYTMYSLSQFPAVTKNGSTSIHVEIYEVDEETLQLLYILEGYSGKRNDINNWYDSLDLETPYGIAEMFYFKYIPNGRIIESGNWVG